MIESAAAALSGAPVSIGDGNTFTTKIGWQMTSRIDGLLLKPDRPAFSIDDTFISRAFPNNKNVASGQVTHTFTMINNWRWDIVMSALVQYEVDITTTKLHLPLDRDYIVYSYSDYSWMVKNAQLVSPNSTNETLFTLSKSAELCTFQVFYVAPVHSNGIAYLGETWKWGSVSNQRILDYIVSPNSIQLELIGGSNESVILAFWINFKVIIVACQLSVSGHQRLIVHNDGSSNCDFEITHHTTIPHIATV
jgi:hypothetical protein